MIWYILAFVTGIMVGVAGFYFIPVVVQAWNRTKAFHAALRKMKW